MALCLTLGVAMRRDRRPCRPVFAITDRIVISSWNEQPQSEVAAESDGKRALHRFRQHDFEQRAGRVGLRLPAPGAEAVKVDRAALGSAHDDALRLGDVNAGRTQPPALQ